MISIAFGLACLGVILLSLSLRRHYRQLWPESPHFRYWRPRNRLLGYALLFLSAAPCIVLRGPWIGLVLWLSILALAAFLQAMLLAWRPAGSAAFAAASLLIMLGEVLL